MAVTTRTYNIANATPVQIIESLSSALTDLGWISNVETFGYLTTFTNTAGSTLTSEVNERYLVEQSATTGTGTGALFDVFRNPYGAISTVTLVTGGEGYEIFGFTGASSSGNVITVTTTANINVGMVVTKIAGTGTLATLTTVTSVVNGTQVSVDQTPTVTLSAAIVTFADTLTISASSIGGSTYVTSATGTGASATITVTDPTNMRVGQRVTGSNIGSLASISSISGYVATLTKNNYGTVSGNVTLSDEIEATVTGVVNYANISGTASGLTITNVATNTNIYPGAKITLTSGTPDFFAEDLPVFISTITGTGPYTLTLRNPQNTFKGFTTTGAITFKASKGDTSGWFAYDIYTAPQTYAWAVAKIQNSSDRLGTTYWGFYVGLSTTFGQQPYLYIKPMPGFNPVTVSSQGVTGIDWFTNATMSGAPAPANTLGFTFATAVASSWFVPAILKTRQSALDSNFATFSFFEGNNNKNPFFLSKYNNALQPWSLNDVFLGGVYEVYQIPYFAVTITNTTVYDGGINFRLKMNGLPKRMAEAGYGNYNLATTVAYTNTFFHSVSGNRILALPIALYDDVALYSRQLGDIQTDVGTTYPVYKSIPINPHFLPVPYYLPDDFILVELPWLNASIGDTVTVSPSEIYTIIQVATNQVSFTSLALAARTT